MADDNTEGKTVPVLVRVDPDLLEALDGWRRKQPDIPTRPEALRRLTWMALTPSKKVRPK